MTALICGSVAYDTVMVFEGEFKVMATVGHDFGPYRAWMHDNGLPADFVRELADEYTAQAYITTDAANNQITAFHPGAMNRAHLNEVPRSAGITLGIVAPESHRGMLEHAAQFAAAGIPFVFDPGQAMTLLGGEDLRGLVERTGWGLADIADKVQALVVTRGAEGSHIHAGGRVIEIPPVKATTVADPTGCGDAYRGGLLYGLQRGLDWAVTGRIASLMGALKVAHHGTQNHRFGREEFARQYRAAFGIALEA
jgi:adenosine kinase